ncbi:uncharacterized protein LOC127792249 [Diospyros lotus]|uniref:uncharacterized protein LOC127792249 n=1 Tax=Diospyros lotus TaxID=55363 RepID=UPI002250C036|nr:uncharacterized protein LOC127792249 [Diospyros lotus]
MASSNFSAPNPPIFTGENYQVWAIKMRAYLRALSLWEVVENDDDPAPLRQNPTLAQIKKYEDDLAKKPKALAIIHSAISDVIFTRIMACESPKEVWDKLKEEFEGNDRVKTIKLLALKREYEMLRMKDGETINEFESKISAIEESCDLKHLSVAELISKLQAQEQRTSMRLEETVEEALVLKHKYKKNGGKKSAGDKESKGKASTEPQKNGKFPPCGICKTTNHLEKDCFYKGKPQYQCRFCNKYEHIERYCRLKMDQYKQ